MKDKFLLLLLLALLGFSTCLDDPIELIQYGRVDGTIVALDTDLPLAGVSVSTNPVTRTIQSDETGYFAFDSLPADNYSLRFRKDGYEDEAMAVDLTSVLEVTLDVVMNIDLAANLAPDLPSSPQPADGAEVADLSVELKWQGTDPNPEDSLTYDVLFFRGNQTGGELLLDRQGDTTLLVENLAYGTLYSWQVIVYDGVNDPVYGPVWQFTVRQRPEMPILFVREVNELLTIWSAGTTGEMTQLVERTPASWRPKRSPVGDRIAFLSLVGTDAHIFTCNAVGEDIRRVTTVPVGGYDLQRVSFSWGPAGDRLIYPAFDKLYLINVDGTGLTELAQAPAGRIFEAVAWSAFNNRIVVRTQGAQPYQNELYRYEMTSGNLILLLGDVPGTLGNPGLSLDGNQLLYTQDLSGLEVPSGRQNNASVFLAPLSNLEQGVNLSGDKPAGFNDGDPQLTPDEAWVIMTEWSCDESGFPNIVRVPADGSEGREVVVINGRMVDWR